VRQSLKPAVSGLRPTVARWDAKPAEPGATPPARDARAEERRLIERARSGDHEAFAALVRGQQRRVFGLIANLLRRPSDVEDIAQQVFLKVYQALPRFDFRASFSTWVYRIAVNECYDFLRRQRAQKSPGESEVAVGDLAALERMAAAERPEAAAGATRALEARQMVEQLFRRLSAEDRLLMTLRELEGLSIDEISAATGIKPNTVKVRLFRARRRLIEVHRRFLAGRRSGGKG